MMKTFKILFLCLTSLALVMPFATQKSVAQETTVVREEGCVREPQAYMEPETLATMAYRGYLEKENIPGYEVFIEQFKSGKITGQMIIDAAVKGCLLSDKYGVASHKNYAQEVQQQVRLIIQENSGR